MSLSRPSPFVRTTLKQTDGGHFAVVVSIMSAAGGNRNVGLSVYNARNNCLNDFRLLTFAL